MLHTIEWISDHPDQLVPGRIRMVDQTRLPVELVWLETADPEEVWDAIKQLKVRGAPAIGVAAAMGVVAGAQAGGNSTSDRLQAVETTADYLATSRPTAQNLFWALDRMRGVARDHADLDSEDFLNRLAREAIAVRDEDEAQCREIGRHGLSLMEDNQTVLTHCNAGSLATARFGTALAPVYLAKEQGRKVRVIADETRPLLQGARLTAWELAEAGIEVTLICDNMSAQVMKEGKVDLVMVGSDRIAANGDVANKIGTYGVAVLAQAHQIPFYVLAPSTTFDLSLATGDEIPIEKRDPREVSHGFGTQTAPDGIDIYTPAFDVTPAELVTAIVTEKGIAYPPYASSIRNLLGSS